MKFTLLATLLVYALCANARTLTKRDAKSDLLTEIDEYVKKAKDEIVKLIKDTQKDTADHLQKRMDELLAVAKEFKTTTGPEAVKLLTDKITTLLGAFKATVNVLTAQTKAKDELLENAQNLLSNVEEEVQRLLSAGRLIPGDLLKKQQDKLKERIEALKKASDSIALKALELDINLLMVRIIADLKLLGFEASTSSVSPSTAPITVPLAPRAEVETKGVKEDETNEPTTIPTTSTTFMCNTHPE